MIYIVIGMELPKIDQELAREEIVDFVKEIYYESDSVGFVIGLSGGFDSTVVAFLLKEAVGNENVYSYHLSSLTTPKEDTEHARLVAELLNISFREINIDSISNEFLSLVNCEDYPDKKIVKGNLIARIRMTLLYYFANLKNCLVVGTSNRSELLFGYFTKYGDSACDFEPIGDIYKTQLKKLAESWNIPDEIINKPPSASLWENQLDEDDIGFTYDVLDRLLYLIVDKKLSDEDILKKMNVSSSEITGVREKIANNKHKLYPPPKSISEGKDNINFE